MRLGLRKIGAIFEVVGKRLFLDTTDPLWVKVSRAAFITVALVVSVAGVCGRL